MNIKNVLPLLMFLFLFSCSSKNKLLLGAEFSEKVSDRNRILTPTNSLITSKKIVVHNVSYDIGIKDSKIKYISTIDPNFKVKGLKIGNHIAEIFDESEIQFVSGWGYYIKINSEWYAGFGFKTKPTKESKIEWFFKYKFIR